MEGTFSCVYVRVAKDADGQSQRDVFVKTVLGKTIWHLFIAMNIIMLALIAFEIIWF